MTTTTERVSIYQPTQDGLIFPEMATFRTAAEERLHRKQRLAAACRMFSSFGFSYGFAGHLTVRDPEHTELYWTNPFGVHFGQVRVSSLILVDHSGKVVEGRHSVNRAGFVIHSAIHAHNPHIVASCHAHTVHGAAWAAMGRKLDMVTQDAAAFFESHVVLTDEAGSVVVEDNAGDGLGKAFGRNRIAIHQNHGLFSAGETIDEAAWWFAAFEHACRVQLLVEAGRRQPKPLSDEAARHSAGHLGTPYIGWLHFQTIYDKIVADQPDFLD